MKRLIAVCILFGLGIGAVAQSDAPYIYYYSRLLEGWVIERADGTDSRLYAQGMMPPEHLVVWERGWSPSGEWFAWLSAPSYNTQGRSQYTLWLVNIDGNHLPLFRLMAGFTDAYWAADEDVLYLVDAGYPDDVVYRFDIGTRQIAMQTAGEIEPRPLKPSTDGTETENAHISPDGRYSIALYTGVLTDTQTGAEVRLRRFSGYASDQTCGVNWHPGGEWLIRDDQTVPAGGGCGGGFVAANVTGRVQRELGLCLYPSNGVCANWLPEQVTSRLSPGLAHSVVPEPFLTLQHEGNMKAVAWRQDGTALAVYESPGGSRTSERLLIWTFEGGEATLTDVFDVYNCHQDFHFNCEVEWSLDGTKIALTDDYRTQIVDTASGESVIEVEQSFAGWMDAGKPVLAGGKGDADYHLAEDLLARTIDPDGERWFDAVQILEVATGKVLHTFRSNGGNEGSSVVTAVSFLPDGRALAILEYGDLPRLWKFTRNEWLRLDVAPGDSILDLTAAGAYIIGHGRESLVYIWDAATGDLVTRLNLYGWSVALSPDGRTLVTAGGGGVYLWDIADFLAP